MQSVTVEYQRFGESTGVIRTSDPYLRTNGTTGPIDEVCFEISQARLIQGMAALDYDRFRTGDEETVRHVAERFLADLQPYLEKFLPTTPPPEHNGQTYQLEIVTRALELAQLPFEILEEGAAAGAVITRRIRQPWPTPKVVRENSPKVLFAWAEPKMRPTSSKVMEVPHARHRDLLDSLLTDWGGFATGAAVELKHATRKSLAKTLAPANHGFTHVHLLAHGIGGVRPDPHALIDLKAEPGPSTFLALQKADGSIDRCPPEVLGEMFPLNIPRPASLAIATCHGAEIESIEAGGTLAHVLHSKGIPVVVASQLAMTKKGSDQLIETFLKNVIHGDDPREAIRACREALRENQKETYYDRVALVGYVHVDDERESRLAERKFAVALARLKAASKYAEQRVREILPDLPGGERELSDTERRDAEDIRKRFASVREGLEELVPDASLKKDQREELHGLQASSLKREAEAAWNLSCNLSGEDAEEWLGRSREALRKAAAAYARAAEQSRDHHWTWVQWLVVEAIVHGSLEEHATDWITARAAAGDATKLRTPDGSGDDRESIDKAIWGHGSLMELCLLAPLTGSASSADGANHLEEAEQHLAQLCAYARPLEFEYDPVQATQDQLDRYSSWWGADEAWSLPRSVVEGARQLGERLRALTKQEHSGDSDVRD